MEPESRCEFCGDGVFDLPPQRERPEKKVCHAALKALGLNTYALCYDCWDGLADQYEAAPGDFPETPHAG